MGLLKEALLAFRGRRFVEWIFTERPQLPVFFAISFYTVLYFNYKYDLFARIQGQQPYNNYSYVREAAEKERQRQREQARRGTATVSVTSPSSSSSIATSLSSTGVN